MEPTTGWTERKLSPCYFPRFPFRPPCRRFHLAPSPLSSPQAISHGFPPVHLHLAPSHRSSPQAISHGFPSVHPIVASISLLPRGALPKLFPTVPFRSFPTELSPCYFPPFPFHPPCRRFRIAPSQRSSPEAISHEISFPSTLSSLPYRSFSPYAISHGFPSVHLVITSGSLLPNGSDGRGEGRGNRGEFRWEGAIRKRTYMWREGKPWGIAWGELCWEEAIRKRRQGGRRGTVGNSMGRAPCRGEGVRWKRRQGGRKGKRGKKLGESSELGRSDTEAMRGWTERKP